MQRRSDGWYLELVAFGSSRTRVDELVASIPNMKELRAVPLTRNGVAVRALGLSLEAGHEHLPIHVAILAYAPKDDFVPSLAAADGVLYVDADGPPDPTVLPAIDAALEARPGSPPRIVERAVETKVKEHLRTLVKRMIQSLKAGHLHAFWTESAKREEEERDAAMFGALTRDRILSQPEGELVPFLLKLANARGRRAAATGRLPNAQAFERSLNTRWQRLFAVSALEALVADAGIEALFGAPGKRAMEPDEVAAALSGLRRIGAVKKAAIVDSALAVAREALLWEKAATDGAPKVLEELSGRYYAVDDEPLGVRLEADVRRAADEYTLSVYED